MSKRRPDPEVRLIDAKRLFSEELNRLMVEMGFSVERYGRDTCEAVSGRYAPENLFGNCSALLDLIGLDSGTDATRDYCSAIVQWCIDQLKGE